MPSVAIVRDTTAHYSKLSPFHPPKLFPEIARLGLERSDTDAGNAAYQLVRKTLACLGLDGARFGTTEWNPLGCCIRPGDKVVIKPNLVLHEFGGQAGANCLTTHGSVIRAVLDYAALAAGPEGRITIADAPLQGADFSAVLRTAGLAGIQEYYRQQLRREVEIVDLRQVHAVIDEGSSFIRRVEQLAGDPRGYREIDLDGSSRLDDLDRTAPQYVVGDYDASVTNRRHRRPHHEYVVSRTVLEADAVISVPKLKTHSKAGVTVCLKNLVGIIGSKDCLPHHRHGKSNSGGDEFPANYPAKWLASARAYALMQGRVPQFVWRVMRPLARTILGAGTPANGNGRQSAFFPSGGWHGNDTIWRVVDDLNRILFFYDNVNQRMSATQQRRYFAIVDGITAMEGNGPLRGTPKHCGVVLGGGDPLAMDVVAATLMGFDWQRIRLLKGIAAYEGAQRYSGVRGDNTLELTSDATDWNSFDAVKANHLAFNPPNGWRGFIEQEREQAHVG